MHWWGFLSYFLGSAAAKAIGTFGLFARGGAIALGAIGYLILRPIEKRAIDEARR